MAEPTPTGPDRLAAPGGAQPAPGLAVTVWLVVSSLGVGLGAFAIAVILLADAARASEGVALGLGALAGVTTWAGFVVALRRQYQSGRRIAALLAPPLASTVALGIIALFISNMRMQSGEASQIGALRTLTTAQALFREGDKDRNEVLDYAGSLELLGKAGLIDGVLATGTKQGYTFRIIHADEFTWSCAADPAAQDGSGERWFFVDETGVIRYSTTGRATSLDTAIGG